MDQDALIGTMFAGRFHIEDLLGAGGMGAVYLARHEVLQRRLALKVLHTEMLSDPRMDAQFRREARAASRVEHPNIIRIVDFGQDDDGRLYLAMEYVEGPTLADVLRQDSPFPVPRALRVIEQIADALGAAHSCNVIHRDLKPYNIVLTTSSAGEPDHVKILDFGLAKILDPFSTAGLSAHGQLFGTPEYMSPERCMDAPADHRSDIYSLGIIAFELIVGRVPFRGKVVQTLSAHINDPVLAPSAASGRDDIPAELDQAVLRCLAKKPEDRLQSAGELLRVVRTLQRQLDPTPRLPPEARERHWKQQLMKTMAPDDQVAPDAPVHDTVVVLRPQHGGEATTESRQLEALERLVYALRDRGLGTPQLTCGLAGLLEAQDEQLRVRSMLHMLQHQLEEVQMTARLRESRLGQVLHQLTHELHQAPGEALQASVAAVTGRIQQLSEEVHAQEQKIHGRAEDLRRSLAAWSQQVRQRAAALRQALAPLAGQMDLSGDPELRNLAAGARIG